MPTTTDGGAPAAASRDGSTGRRGWRAGAGTPARPRRQRRDTENERHEGSYANCDDQPVHLDTRVELGLASDADRGERRHGDGDHDGDDGGANRQRCGGNDLSPDDLAFRHAEADQDAVAAGAQRDPAQDGLAEQYGRRDRTEEADSEQCSGLEVDGPHEGGPVRDEVVPLASGEVSLRELAGNRGEPVEALGAVGQPHRQPEKVEGGSACVLRPEAVAQRDPVVGGGELGARHVVGLTLQVGGVANDGGDGHPDVSQARDRLPGSGTALLRGGEEAHVYCRTGVEMQVLGGELVYDEGVAAGRVRQSARHHEGPIDGAPGRIGRHHGARGESRTVGSIDGQRHVGDHQRGSGARFFGDTLEDSGLRRRGRVGGDGGVSRRREPLERRQGASGA